MTPTLARRRSATGLRAAGAGAVCASLLLGAGCTEAPLPGAEAPPSAQDAGAVDVDAPLADAEPPPEPPRYPLACPALDDCDSVPFHSIEAPDGVELREGAGRALLGYDTRAGAFVAYDVVAGADALRLDELRRFDQSYDRVTLDGKDGFLGCKGAACELSRGGTYPVPPELDARVAQSGCVAGQGVVCLEWQGEARWRWTVKPGVFAEPIAAIERFGSDLLVADAVGGLYLVGDGSVTLLATMPSPFVELSSGFAPRAEETWVARTAEGQVVVGRKSGAEQETRTCALDAAFARTGWAAPLYVVRDDTLYDSSFDGRCSAHRATSAIRGVGITSCGVATGAFWFDERRVYAQKIRCVRVP